MTPAASLVVLARWLDESTVPVLSPVDGLIRARDGAAFGHWLAALHERMPPGEAAREVVILAKWLDEASSDPRESPMRALAWLQPFEADLLRDIVLDLADLGAPAFGDHAPPFPPPVGMQRFFVACEYLLRRQLGERGKIARARVADAWGLRDGVVSVYTSHERQYADRLLAATLAGTTNICERRDRAGEALEDLPLVARRCGRSAARLTRIN